MPQVEQHLCHAVGCNIRIPPNRLMCAYHWYMVPPVLRRGVWRTYRPGQEVDKRPSKDYLDVAREAINYVAREEGQPEVPEGVEIIKTLEALLAKEREKNNGK